jgi:polyprenyldihydroxybenzoate methyltransferase/3-demethylubiquinol 3-O-methyltransferase
MFLSTIARTPLSYLLSILIAEHVLHQVTPGTHTHSKYVNPSELLSFFQSYSTPQKGGSPITTDTRPWVSRTDEQGRPRRTEAEVRGIVYLPWKGQWVLMPREATTWGAAQCNYLFWVRKPMEG